MIDSSKDENVEQKEKAANRDCDRQRCRVALVVTGRQFSEQIIFVLIVQVLLVLLRDDVAGVRGALGRCRL